MSRKNSVFVTGHKGFLGSHTLEHLSHDFLPKTFDGDLFEIDQKFLDGSEKFLFHFAGFSYPAKCVENPQLAYKSNLLLTEHILSTLGDTLSRANATFVFFSTAHVYDLSLGERLSEDSSLSLDSIYARSKFAAELLVRDLCSFYKLPYVIVRLFNTSHKTQVGPFFMPTVYSQLLEQKNSPKAEFSLKLGQLNVVNDFLCLQDFLAAMRAITKKASIESDSISGIYNLCSGIGKPLADVVNELCQQMGIEYTVESSKEIFSKRIGNPKKFEEMFMWKPEFSNSTKVFVKNFLD